jgi:hypothetical protein
LRYSEDLDIDVIRGSPHSLREKMDRLLASTALRDMLVAQGLELTRSSRPKQTETTQRWKLELRAGDLSLPLHTRHRLAPTFFGGFDTTPGGVRLARPEKALLDSLYLAPARSRLFAALPEVEIPKGFDRKEARRWLSRIPSGPRRRLVERRLERLLRSGS